MKIKSFMLDFTATFVVSFVVTALVTYLYNLIAYGTRIVDWETAFRFAIILAVILPIRNIKRDK